MICNGYKGGIGTASRTLTANQGGYTVGVLVQCNYGGTTQLRIAGINVGREIPSNFCREGEAAPSNPMIRGLPRCTGPGQPEFEHPDVGSIIIVVATDAPLMPQQIKRLARRAALGIGREGGVANNGSGDIFIAFSTANAGAYSGDSGIFNATMLKNDRMDPVLLATVQATEEAITNAMIANRTRVGADNVRVIALPHERLQEVLRKYNRLIAR
jgi:L-aminopeptidase/D-esterase-like protein